MYIVDTGSGVENFNRAKGYISQKNIVLIQYASENQASINNYIVKNHIVNDTELLLFCHIIYQTGITD